MWPFKKKQKGQTNNQNASNQAVDEAKEFSRKANRALHEIYDLEIQKGYHLFINNNEPVTSISVSKISHENKYHSYSDADFAEVGDYVEVYEDEQYGDSWSDSQYVYVVSIGGSEVGELSESVMDKIHEYVDGDNAVYAVKQVDTSGDKTKLKLNVYERDSEIPGHRTWSMDLRGTNYEGRDIIIKEIGSVVCKLEATNYEGEPAIKVTDAIDRIIGWAPKDSPQI